MPRSALSVLVLLGVAAPGLAARAVAEGGVSVVVELAAPFAPEGELGPGGRALQRTGIRAAGEALLADLGADTRAVRHRYASIPFLALRVDPAGLERLAASPWVRDVHEDRRFALALDSTVPIVEADQLAAIGIDATGWTVVVIDSGVDDEHPNLAGKLVAEACFGGTGPGQSGDCPNGKQSQIGSGAGLYCTFHPDCYHGSHVAGIATAAAGPPNWPGVARAANLISIRVATLEESALVCSPQPAPCLVVLESDMLAGLELVYDDFRHDHDVAAVNLSIAGASYSSQGACDAANASLKAAIDNLRSVDIATVASSGNGGQTNAIGEPACISTAVSVGATTDGDSAAAYSNRAPFLSLWAPGNSVHAPWYQTSSYISRSGTSMAAPHVAGAWALLRQVLPGASVGTILTALRDTGAFIGATPGGATRIAVRAAYESLTIDCADGLDNDGDGWADYPADPGCASPSSSIEDPQCQDGADNDSDGTLDFDGGASLNEGVPVAEPDPECASSWQNREKPAPSCGLGFELVPALVVLARARRRGRR